MERNEGTGSRPQDRPEDRGRSESRHYADQGSGWFGDDARSGGATEDASRNASRNLSSDRRGQFDDPRRGGPGAGRGGSGGQGGPSEGSGSYGGSTGDTRPGGERDVASRYEQERYRPQGQGGSGGRDADPHAWGGSHQGRDFGRNDERDYRSQQYAGGRGYDSGYGQGGAYGGGIHRRDMPGQQGQAPAGQQSVYGAQQPGYGHGGYGRSDYAQPPTDAGARPSYGGSSDWGRRHEYGVQGGYGEHHWGEGQYREDEQRQAQQLDPRRAGLQHERHGVGSAFGSGSSTYGQGYGSAAHPQAQPGPPGPSEQWAAQRSPQPAQPRRRGPKNYQRSDERLRELISDRLLEDAQIDSSDVSVEVKSGEVSLTGTVDDRRTKYQIEELVEQIHGVRDIDNRLKIRRGFFASLFGAGADDETSGRGEPENVRDGGASERREGTTGDRGMQTSGAGTQTGATPTTSTESVTGSTLSGGAAADGTPGASGAGTEPKPPAERSARNRTN